MIQLVIESHTHLTLLISSSVDAELAGDTIQILNGSSFAAATLANGDKIICFQDASAQILGAIWSQNTQSWSAVDLILESAQSESGDIVPQLNTPMDVTVCGSLVSNPPHYVLGVRLKRIKINIFYIATRNYVVQLTLSTISSTSSNGTQSAFTIIPSSTKLGTSILSVTSYSTAGSSSCDMLLFYENEVSNITALQTFQNFVNPFSGTWTNKTDALYESLQTVPGAELELSAPFTSAFVPQSLLTSIASEAAYVCQVFFSSVNASSNQQLISTVYYPANESFQSGMQLLSSSRVKQAKI